MNAWQSILLDAALKSALVLALAWLAVTLMRKTSAAARHLVWFLAVAALPLLPVLSWALPGWHVLPGWMEVKQTSIASLLRTEPPIAAPPAVVVPATAEPLPQVSPVELPAAGREQVAPVDNRDGRAVEAIGQPRQEANPVVAAFDYGHWALVAWLAVALLALAPAVLGMMSLWRLEWGARRENEPGWLQLLQRLVERLGLRRRVHLLKSGRRRMPMTWGVIRPRLLLPEESREWPEERRRVVMLHELAHAKRLDYLTNLVTQFACALYWFNPLVWLAARRMAAERERACDDIVLNHGAKPADYAEQVLQIAAGLPVTRFTALGGIPMARRSGLEGRLRAILDGTRNRRSLSHLVLIAMLAALALVVVPVAMLKAAAPETMPVAVPTPLATNPPVGTNAATNEQTHLVCFFDAPNRTQKKFEITGNLPAAPPAGASLRLTEFKLITYQTNGEMEFTLTAPNCDWTYLPGNAVASSAGPLHAESGDGHFVIDGTGFLWRQGDTNDTLIISNNVLAVDKAAGTRRTGGHAAYPPGTISPTSGEGFVFVFTFKAAHSMAPMVIVDSGPTNADSPAFQSNTFFQRHYFIPPDDQALRASVAQSDLIVAGKLVEVTQESSRMGGITGGMAKASQMLYGGPFQITEVIKGKAPANNVIYVNIDLRATNWPVTIPLTTGDQLILLLKHSSLGLGTMFAESWRTTDLKAGALPYAPARIAALKQIVAGLPSGATPQTGAAMTNHPWFLPEVEKVLDTHGALGARAYLSFSNGIVAEESSAENPQRNRQLHRDLKLQTIEGEQEWTGVDLEVAPATEAMWNTPADQLVAALADDLAPPLPTMQVTPGVWFFKMRDGTYGLLRVVGFVEPRPGERAMKVVYKLARPVSEQKRAAMDLFLPERIRQFLAGELATTGSSLEIWEQDSVGGMALRKDLVTTEIHDVGDLHGTQIFGHVHYLKSANRFYIQWEGGMGASTLHYYGPFEGDPVKVLGLPGRNRAAGDWGETKDGIAVGLAATKTVWSTSEKPELTAWFRNHGTNAADVTSPQEHAELEVDGVVYSQRYAYNIVIAPSTTPQQPDRFRVNLADEWGTVATSAAGFGPVNLAPGKHTVRLVIIWGAGQDSIRAVSNPVEVEIAGAALQPSPVDTNHFGSSQP